MDSRGGRRVFDLVFFVILPPVISALTALLASTALPSPKRQFWAANFQLIFPILLRGEPWAETLR